MWSIRHWVTTMSLTPPLISLPMTMPPWPLSSRQLRMTVCSQLFFSFMPRKTLLAFMAMQSSPTWMFTPMMRVYAQRFWGQCRRCSGAL